MAEQAEGFNTFLTNT